MNDADYFESLFDLFDLPLKWQITNGKVALGNNTGFPP